MPSALPDQSKLDQLLLLADDLPVMVWVTQPDATCVFLNQRWYDYTGQSAAEALGLGWLTAVHPDDAKMSGDIFLTANQAQQTFALDYRLRAADGTYRWMKDTGRPRFNDRGTFLGFFGTVTDIHELKITQQRLQMAIESNELGTWDLNPATGELIWSNQCKALFGLPPQASVSYPLFLQGVHPDDRQRTDSVVQAALQGHQEGFYSIEYRTIGLTDGQLRWVRAQGQAYFDQQGVATRFVGMVVDITHHKLTSELLEQRVAQQTHQLQVANHELQRSNESLQQFAFIASHDLQEPLRKIQQFGNLLKTRQADLTEESLLYLDRMQSGASRMSTLIKDLLDFSRLSTQQEASKPVSLQTVVEGVLTTLEFQVDELSAQIRVGLLPTVVGDASQLNQLFQNLLSNALKFRRPGQQPLIDIKAGLLAVEKLPAGVKPGRSSIAYHQIAVIDDGIGFDENHADRIFQVFQRLHGKSEYAGTGIGLAICEKVVANHGGVITATSQPGQGATFTIYLPA
ncbi:PAS domain-containing protein [Spirosoma sp. KNUC1025]|uniref:sensor histidine kinase n=1 Tax=Spirosoma sp. KNUC1025 TaxID=2894082 RepID=UPI001E606549|nr:PAS domain-containing protein [Spirosoma sp. KNUC1025]UFH57649.1 PAS domain-containing protein [Spirosoma sp. KNUC1025]